MSEHRLEYMNENPDMKSWGFLVLLRELRDIIYGFALVGSTAATVLCSSDDRQQSGKERKRDGDSDSDSNGNSRDDESDPPLKWNYLGGAPQQSVHELIKGLLFCSRIVASEAARVFYSQNVFWFTKDIGWGSIVNWLECIGEINRCHLTRLLIHTFDNTNSMQYRYTNIATDIYGISFVSDSIPRDPNGLARRWVEEIDRLNLVISRVFELLRGTKDTSTLTIGVSLRHGYVPGIGITAKRSYDVSRWWMSMELPDLMEKWRVAHANGPEYRIMQLEWHCITYTSML